MADTKRKPGTFGCSHCGARHDIGPQGQLRCPLAEGEADVWNTDSGRTPPADSQPGINLV